MKEKRRDTWMPFYIGDYLRDTQHLNAEKHGAYVLLIFAYWVSGAPLPDDDEHLATVARLTLDRWQHIRATIAAFFDVGDGLWRHKRVDIELRRAKRISRERSKAGVEGAAKRWQDDGNATGGTMANAMANGSQPPSQNDTPSPSPSQLQKESKNPPVAPRKRVACLTADQLKIFDEWYALYPLHKARLAAERSFLGALARASPAELLAGAARYRDECAGKEARYIKHPATWLNQGCWKDENGRTGTGTVHDLPQRRRPTAPPRPEDLGDVGTG